MSTVASGRLPLRQGPGHGDLSSTVGRDGLRGIGDESPYHGDSGAGRPDDQRCHHPVPGLAPQETRRHEDLPGPVIPAGRGDSAAVAVGGKGAMRDENGGEVGDRLRRHRANLLRPSFVSSDVELPEPEHAERDHDREDARQEPQPAGFHSGSQHGHRLIHRGVVPASPHRHPPTDRYFVCPRPPTAIP